VVAARKVAVVPSSALVIVVIAIAADAPFGNRDEAAPMGGVMVDVKGDVWMQRRRLGAAGEGEEGGKGSGGGRGGVIMVQSKAQAWFQFLRDLHSVP